MQQRETGIPLGQQRAKQLMAADAGGHQLNTSNTLISPSRTGTCSRRSAGTSVTKQPMACSRHCSRRAVASLRASSARQHNGDCFSRAMVCSLLRSAACQHTSRSTWHACRCDSGGMCTEVCARGSVAVEPWLHNAIATQARPNDRLLRQCCTCMVVPACL